MQPRRSLGVTSSPDVFSRYRYDRWGQRRDRRAPLVRINYDARGQDNAGGHVRGGSSGSFFFFPSPIAQAADSCRTAFIPSRASEAYVSLIVETDSLRPDFLLLEVER